MVKNGYALTFYVNGVKYEYKHFEKMNEASSAYYCLNHFINEHGGVIGNPLILSTQLIDSDIYIHEIGDVNELN